MKLLNGGSASKSLTGNESSAYIESFVANDLGSLADGTAISLKQQIDFKEIEGEGENPSTYDFKEITFEVSAGTTTQTVSFFCRGFRGWHNY
jgi:hypothetical protein